MYGREREKEGGGGGGGELSEERGRGSRNQSNMGGIEICLRKSIKSEKGDERNS